MPIEHVFISHSSKNKDIAWQLTKDLQAEGYTVWLDRLEIEPSENFVRELEDGLDKTAVILVIWTEHAKNSAWVEGEISRAKSQGKHIIPLLFDDTKITLLLETTQHIDFRASYHRPFLSLTSRLNALLEDINQLPPQNTTAPWNMVFQPSLRSRFLEENNYLDRKDSQFATNKKTASLINYQSTALESYATLVAVPVPNSLHIDFDVLPEILNLRKSPYGVGKSGDNRPWMWFSLANLQNKRSEQAELTLFDPSRDENTSSPPKMLKYLRFNVYGAIEFADGDFVHFIEDRNLRTFSLISILGSVWKFVNFVSNVYQALGYNGTFQLLINLRNTAGTILSDFAWEERNQNPSWSSPLTGRLYRMEPGMGMATDDNLQYIFNINTEMFWRQPEISEDWMVKLSRELQRSYNYDPDARHYSKGTLTFPWHQYSYRNEI